MLYRNVIEQLNTDQLKYDKYIFVGFNVLNKVEKEFFRKLQKQIKQYSIGIMTSSIPNKSKT